MSGVVDVPVWLVTDFRPSRWPLEPIHSSGTSLHSMSPTQFRVGSPLPAPSRIPDAVVVLNQTLIATLS